MNNTDCGILIKQIHTMLEKGANNALKNDDMTVAQITVLMTLYETAEKQMSMKDLEKILHVAQPTVAGLAFRLAQKGYIVYAEDAEDKRMKIVRITAAGIRCCKNAERMMIVTEEKLLSALDESERAMFRKLLMKVRDALE